MSKTLVVVESPAKAKTIKKYLGAAYEVKASIGHIKDLPASVDRSEKSKEKGSTSREARAKSSSVVGVDLANGYQPQYEIIPGKEKVIKELREAARKSGRVLLATDPDREGEAIAWHLSEELQKPPDTVFRVLFNELTERTIKQAIESPSPLDPNKYNAQQARRILDRIVGYQLSPLLWEKVQYGLSAGRVQSVALRLIVDRQDSIDTFVPHEYWSLTATLEASSPPVFEAKLAEDRGEKIEITDIDTCRGIVERALHETFIVEDVKRKQRSRKPQPPFITSTMQQEGSRKLKMSSSRTMRVAQQLYEGVELGKEGSMGLITYMRTDSPRIAPEAVDAIRGFIKRQYGARYLPDKPHVFKGRKSAQEAHEAIRPTSTEHPPEKVAPYLDRSQLALYKLIWNRFVASQMAPAIFDQTTAHIGCGTLTFRVTGSIMKFDGFLRVYQEGDPNEGSAQGDEDAGRRLPPLQKGDTLSLMRLSPKQHFTQAPPPFNEATLIRELEEKGIGRPSTYAEIVSTIQKRKYVELVDKRFHPTVLGRIISKLLLDSFPQLLDSHFTAEMESSLDLIEDGAASLFETLDGFYQPFQTDLQDARQKMKNIKRDGLPTRAECPECGASLLLRSGRYGLFLGCSAYPQCSYTRNIADKAAVSVEPIPTDEECPQCGAHMVIRQGRTGAFLSCSRYPECKTARPIPTGVACPKCGTGELVQRQSKRGRTFYSCDRYPKCEYSVWNKPVARSCPDSGCDSPIMEERWTKASGTYLRCPKCKTKISMEGETAGEGGKDSKPDRESAAG